MKSIKYIIASILILFSYSTLIAAETTHLELNPNNDKYKLAGHIEFIEDPNDTLTLNDVRQKDATQFSFLENNTPNFGFSNASYWLKVRLKNISSAESDSITKTTQWALTSSYAPLAELSVFIINEKTNTLINQWKTGTEVPFNQRPLNHRSFIFPFEMTQGDELTVYVKAISETSVQVPLEIWKTDEFLAIDGNSIYYWGLYFGIMLSLLAYNTLMYISVRHSSYAYYLIYVISLSGVVLFLNGQGFQFLWPNFQLWNAIALPFFTGATVASVVQFSRIIFKSNTLTPVFDRIMLCYISLGVFSMLTPFMGFTNTPQIAGLIGAMIPIILITAGILSWKAGNTLALFFTCTWVFYSLALICYLLNVFGIIPSNAFTSNALQIGSAGEVILLSFAQAYRMRLERQKRYQALKNENTAIIKWQQAEKHMLHQAQHHPLTFLPNRSLLSQKIDELLKHSDSPKISFSIILIHINRFSEINKTLGKINADQILIQAADRIHLSALDTHSLFSLEINQDTKYNIAMLDSATFACIADTTGMPDTANFITKQIQQAIAIPINFQGMSISLDCSAGIVNYPEDGIDSETLLKHAEVATTLARKHRQSIAVYNPIQDDYSTRRLRLMGDLHQAIDDQQLELYFQPQIDAKTERAIGFEALLRWTHPSMGYIPPTEIIMLAEQCGLMKSITRWALSESMMFGKTLDRLGYQLQLAVNISSNNLHEQDFTLVIRKIIQNHQYNPTKLTLEFNESSIIDHSAQAEKSLQELQKLGIQLSLDQFGSGHTSLSKLKTLPLNQVKISPELVLDITNESDTKNIVDTIIKLSHLLGLPNVGVGAENLLLTNSLKDMNCDTLQGNYIAPAMNHEAALIWLKEHMSTPKKPLKTERLRSKHKESENVYAFTPQEDDN